MGIGDLFKPKWKHSNWKIRKSAVMKLKDKEILKNIVVNDKNYKVRIAAIKNRHFSDQTLITQIVKIDKRLEVRKAAVEKINDSSLLANIAKNHEDAIVRKEAVKNSCFNDDKILSNISLQDSDSSVRIAAIKKLSDQELFIKIASNDKNYDVRLTAIDKIEDQKKIAEIAKKYNSYWRRVVLKKIKNKDLLYDLVINAGYHNDLEVIEDQKLLMEIVGKEKRIGGMQWCPKCKLICKTYSYQSSDPEIVHIICKKCDEVIETEHNWGSFDL